MKHVVASVDIGGTKLAVGIADPDQAAVDGRMIATIREPIPGRGDPAVVVERASELMVSMLDAARGAVIGVGISIGGPLDHRNGIVLNFPHLPDWHDIPLRQIMADRLGAPAFLDNDANLGALAEFRVGAGRGLRDMVYITISSGIGGGVIVNGNLLHGVGSGAGEIGHVTVQPDGPICPCGNRGCLEIMASGRSIARRGGEAVGRDNARGGELLARAGGLPERITSELVAACTADGDPLAVELWEETAEYLAIGLGSAIHLIAPQMIVLGGGVAAAGELLLAPLKRRLRNHVFYIPVDEVRLETAKLGQESPLLGAALLAADSVA